MARYGARMEYRPGIPEASILTSRREDFLEFALGALDDEVILRKVCSKTVIGSRLHLFPNPVQVQGVHER